MPRVRLVSTLIALFAGVACIGTPYPASRYAATLDSLGSRGSTGPAPLLEPGAVGVITLLTVELPEAGSNIGGHFAGVQYDRQVSTMALPEGTRQRWMRSARDAGDSTLLMAGYRVHAPGPPSSDAEPLRGVRFGLAGDVRVLRVKTTGYVEPFLIEAAVQVEWDLIDLSAGAAVFAGSSEGSIRNVDSVDAAVNGAVASALSRLVEQVAFRRALSQPRPMSAGNLLTAEFARRMPRADETIVVGRDQLNPSAEIGVVAGMVMIAGTRNYSASAVVLTQDGLAIAPSSVARHHFVWAVHPGGIGQRAVRLIRVAGPLALIELSCMEPCATVLWEPESLADRTRGVMVAARPSYRPGAASVLNKRGTFRERRRRDAPSTWHLRGAKTLGGEAIAREEDGAVVAVGTSGEIVPLADALRALNVETRRRAIQ